MTPNQASKKSNEKKVYSNLKGNREIQKPKFQLGRLVRTVSRKEIVQIIVIIYTLLPK